MTTLSFEQVSQAYEIYQSSYQAYKKYVSVLKFKAERSPNLMTLKSFQTRINQVNALLKNPGFCELGNDFTCVFELDCEELKQTSLNNAQFIQQCEQLLAGTHQMLQFSTSTYCCHYADIQFLKEVAERHAKKYTELRANTMIQKNSYQFDFCLADIHCVIEKCQAILTTIAPSELAMDYSLLHDWWQTIDKSVLFCENWMKRPYLLVA